MTVQFALESVSSFGGIRKQIAGNVKRHCIAHWIAIDDNDLDWPESERHHLIHTDPELGIAEAWVLQALREKLASG